MTLAQNGKDLGRLLADLLNHFRNLLIYQISRGDLNLLEVSEAEVAALKEQASLASTESLTRILEVLTDAEMRLRDAASKKILLEVALLKAIEARSAISLDSVLKQLNTLRGGGSGTGFQPASPTANSPVHAPASKPTQKTHTAHQEIAAPAAAVEAAPVSADLAGLWSKLVEAVGRVSPFTRSYLVDANPVSFEKNILTIGFDPEFEDHLGLVDNARNHTLLQTKLAELGHANCADKIHQSRSACRPATPQPSAEPRAGGFQRNAANRAAGQSALCSARQPRKKPRPSPSTRMTFKNDPLIQKALEIFKGQIVEVRA